MPATVSGYGTCTHKHTISELLFVQPSQGTMAAYHHQQVQAKTRFDTLVDLLCKYEAQRDTELMQILTEDIKAATSSSENVFIKLFNSMAYSIYSKANRMSALSRSGFDHRAKTSTGLTPLEWVVEYLGDESLEILTSLIAGNDVNVAYSKGNNNNNYGICDQFLLLTAVRRGKLGFVQALLAGGAKLTLPDLPQNSPYAKPTQTLAHAAAEGGHYIILKLLIEKNADVKRPFGTETPLMAAATGVAKGGPDEYNFQRCVEMLVSRSSGPPQPMSAPYGPAHMLPRPPVPASTPQQYPSRVTTVPQRPPVPAPTPQPIGPVKIPFDSRKDSQVGGKRGLDVAPTSSSTSTNAAAASAKRTKGSMRSSTGATTTGDNTDNRHHQPNAQGSSGGGLPSAHGSNYNSRQGSGNVTNNGYGQQNVMGQSMMSSGNAGTHAHWGGESYVPSAPATSNTMLYPQQPSSVYQQPSTGGSQTQAMASGYGQDYYNSQMMYMPAATGTFGLGQQQDSYQANFLPPPPQPFATGQPQQQPQQYGQYHQQQQQHVVPQAATWSQHSYQQPQQLPAQQFTNKQQHSTSSSSHYQPQTSTKKAVTKPHSSTSSSSSSSSSQYQRNKPK